MSVTCNYCGQPAKLIDTKELYGTNYGNAWICKPCDAYVGCHKGTNTPLGTLANKELRKLRQQAHTTFDTLWKNKQITRKEAYQKLQQLMGMTKEQAHIGAFNQEQCHKLIQLLQEEQKMTPQDKLIQTIYKEVVDYDDVVVSSLLIDEHNKHTIKVVWHNPGPGPSPQLYTIELHENGLQITFTDKRIKLPEEKLIITIDIANPKYDIPTLREKFKKLTNHCMNNASWYYSKYKTHPILKPRNKFIQKAQEILK